MPNPICSKHKVEMSFKAGGISKKTNQPYGAFWGCPEKVGKDFCGESKNIPEKLGRLLTMENQYTRDKNYAFWSSTNAAVGMIVPLMKDLVKEKEVGGDFAKDGIKTLRDWFMNEWKEFYIREIILEEDKVVEELKDKLEKE